MIANGQGKNYYRLLAKHVAAAIGNAYLLSSLQYESGYITVVEPPIDRWLNQRNEVKR